MEFVYVGNHLFYGVEKTDSVCVAQCTHYFQPQWKEMFAQTFLRNKI